MIGTLQLLAVKAAMMAIIAKNPKRMMKGAAEASGWIYILGSSGSQASADTLLDLHRSAR